MTPKEAVAAVRRDQEVGNNPYQYATVLADAYEAADAAAKRFEKLYDESAKACDAEIAARVGAEAVVARHAEAIRVMKRERDAARAELVELHRALDALAPTPPTDKEP